jgi:micrococcal nuclease
MRFNIAVFLLLLFSCSNSETSPDSSAAYTAHPDWGRVVSVADGDTFTLLNEEKKQEKVRLHGIDCPERAQAYGQVAKQKLSDLVFGQPVRLERKTKDRYGRTIAVVYSREGENINEALLRAGLAWHYKQHDKNPSWAAIEQRARSEKLGLWADPQATPPWEWRKKGKP